MLAEIAMNSGLAVEFRVGAKASTFELLDTAVLLSDVASLPAASRRTLVSLPDDG